MTNGSQNQGGALSLLVQRVDQWLLRLARSTVLLFLFAQLALQVPVIHCLSDEMTGRLLRHGSAVRENTAVQLYVVPAAAQRALEIRVNQRRLEPGTQPMDRIPVHDGDTLSIRTVRPHTSVFVSLSSHDWRVQLPPTVRWCELNAKAPELSLRIRVRAGIG